MKSWSKYFYFVGVMLTIWSLLMSCNQTKTEHKLIITGHRGASGWAPENTLASFKKAMEIGADYSELDVQLSKDGQVVLLHDATLDRTTTGKGPIAEWNLADLKTLDAGSWFDEKFKGEPLPTLQEVVDLVKGKMKLNIEIKVSEFNRELADKVVALVRTNNFQNECMITSFNQPTMEYVREKAPELQVGLIFGKKYDDSVFSGNWDVLSSNKANIDQKFMKKAHDSGKKVHVWTVNDEKEMQDLIELGVDGIITNYPDLLKKVLAQRVS